MPDPVPDPTRPDAGSGWPAHLMYQVRLFFKEFGASQVGMLLITALLGYIGVQSYNNAGHSQAAVGAADKTTETVITSHKETAALIDATAAKVDAAKSDVGSKVEKLTTSLPPAVASAVKKDK